MNYVSMLWIVFLGYILAAGLLGLLIGHYVWVS